MRSNGTFPGPIQAENGRVPTTSTVATAVIAVGTVCGLAGAAGTLSDAVLGVALGTVLAVGIACGGADRLGILVAGIGAVVVSGPTLAVSLSLRTAVGGWPSGATVLAGSLVGYGCVRFRLDAFGGRRVLRAIGALVAVGVLSLVVALLLALVRFDGVGSTSLLAERTAGSALFAPEQLSTAVPGFFAWIVIVALAGRIAFGVLPIADLAPESRAAEVRTAIGRVRTGLDAIAVLSGTGMVLTALGVAIGAVTFAAIDGVAETVVTSPRVRTTAVRLTAVFVLVAGFTVAVRIVGAKAIGPRAGWPTALAAVAVAVVVAVTIGSGIVVDLARPLLAGTVGEPIAETGSTIGMVIVGLLAVGVLLSWTATMFLVLPALERYGFVPTQVAGPRFVVAGTFLATIVTGATSPPIAAIVGVVGAVLVWDLSEYGVHLNREVGSDAPTRRAELAHAGIAIGVASVLLVTATVVVCTAGEITADGVASIPALAFAALAAAALLTALKG